MDKLLEEYYLDDEWIMEEKMTVTAPVETIALVIQGKIHRIKFDCVKIQSFN